MVGKTAKARGTLRAIQQLVAFALVRRIDGIIVEACEAVTCSPNVELCSVCCRHHQGDLSSGHIPGLILEPRPAEAPMPERLVRGDLTFTPR